MGLIIGLIKWLLKLLLYFTIFAALIVLIPNLPPYTTFSKIELEQTQPRIGALAPNGALNNAEKLYKDKLLGPEAFELYNGDLYTSLATGEIVKVSAGGHVTFVTKIGQPCTGLVQEHICGRPLGFQIDEKRNTMYIADAYYGIWKVDLKTDKKQLLVSPRVEIGGRLPKLFNSVALTKNGDLYWTDSTSDFQLKDGAFSPLSDPSGRLFHYNAAKNESNVVLDNLWFPNGLVISPDNQFVVVAETFTFRLLKYYIDGPKKGKSEVFAAGLPGNPDNLRSLPDGSGVLVALYTVFDDDNPLIGRSLPATPLVRKFLARLQRLIEIPFEFLYNTYPHFIFEEIVYHIGHFRSISGLTPGMSGLLHLDWNGNVVASYFNTDGSLGHLSDAIVYNGRLYTGSPHVQNFIGSVPAPPSLLKAFTTKKVEIKDVPQVAPKPQPTKPVQQELKPKVQEKPKVEEKKDIPKVVKPVAAEPPKPAQVKPIETVKPEVQKPIEKKPHVEAKPTPQVAKPTQSPPKKTEQQQAPLPAKSESEKKRPTQTKQVDAKPDTKPTPKPDTKPSPKPDAKPTPKADSKPTPKPDINPTPKPDTKPSPKPDAQPTPKADSKPTPKPDINPTPKPDAKPTPKADSKPTPKPDINPNPDTKPSPKPDAQPTPKADSKPTPKPDAKPAPKVDPKPTPKPDIKPTTKPEIKTTPPPKPAETKPSTEKPKQESISKNPEETKKTLKDTPKPLPQEIPITEDIPSDTIKPNKEKLKVIKKGGPTEIPNPNL